MKQCISVLSALVMTQYTLPMKFILRAQKVPQMTIRKCFCSFASQTDNFDNYEYIDSGEQLRLERFGEHVVVRYCLSSALSIGRLIVNKQTLPHSSLASTG